MWSFGRIEKHAAFPPSGLKVALHPLLMAYFMPCSLYKQHSESKMSTSKCSVVVCQVKKKKKKCNDWKMFHIYGETET